MGTRYTREEANKNLDSTFQLINRLSKDMPRHGLSGDRKTFYDISRKLIQDTYRKDYKEALQVLDLNAFTEYYKKVGILAAKMDLSTARYFKDVELVEGISDADNITQSSGIMENNPVNYTNPLGLSASDTRQLTQMEIDAHKAATFGTQPVDYSKITVVEGRMPTVQEVRSAAAGVGIKLTQGDDEIEAWVNSPKLDAVSLPNGTIYTKDINPPLDLVVHEIEHQATYQNGATVTYDDVRQLTSAGAVFDELVNEANVGPSVYSIPGTPEFQANQVQNRVP